MSYTVLSDGDTVVLTGVAVSSGKVTIEETVTKNGKTYTVTSIATTAFQNVSGITSISVPVSLCSDLNTAYQKGTYSLEITGKGEVGTEAFKSNKNITSVSFGENVTEIKARAFLGCFSLTTVEDWGGVTKIEEEAFMACNFGRSGQELVIPETVETIEERAFAFWVNPGEVKVALPKKFEGTISNTVFAYDSSMALNKVTIRYYDAEQG